MDYGAILLRQWTNTQMEIRKTSQLAISATYHHVVPNRGAIAEPMLAGFCAPKLHPLADLPFICGLGVSSVGPPK
ncbi:hypothetical protein RvY_04779 [Ramazzottius varieornatus]|uniref:Uncharacterized protein n=1 Tax=Ramazzottius varieornatus TaxID=947166 RepID=A0A1D1UW87_RAMVA|nr:hypothetical protein RvY_04779 [Ramazzottius varieornatus]